MEAFLPLLRYSMPKRPLEMLGLTTGRIEGLDLAIDDIFRGKIVINTAEILVRVGCVVEVHLIVDAAAERDVRGWKVRQEAGCEGAEAGHRNSVVRKRG